MSTISTRIYIAFKYVIYVRLGFWECEIICKNLENDLGKKIYFLWVQMKASCNLLTPYKTASGKFVFAVFHHSCVAPIPMIYSHGFRTFNAPNHSEIHKCIENVHTLTFIIAKAFVKCWSLRFTCIFSRSELLLCADQIHTVLHGKDVM